MITKESRSCKTFNGAIDTYYEDKTYIPKLRMQALTLLKDIIRPSIPLIDVNKDLYNTADQLVHYCLTGEHQLPEKKG